MATRVTPLQPIAARYVRMEVALLAAFAFFLPLFEAPKNILWLLYLATWLVNRARARDFGGPWRMWDSLIAALIVSAPVGAAFAGLPHGEWNGVRDVVRYGLMLWALSRTRYGAHEWRKVFIALLAGTLAGSAEGAWRMWQGKRDALELHSVGHSNHSAVYLTILFGACLAWLCAFWKDLQAPARALWLAGIALCGVAIVLSGSRVALLAAGAIAPIVGAFFIKRSWKPLLVIVIAAMAGAAIITVEQPLVVRKQLRNMGNDNVLAYRDIIWERAVAAWREYPVFGIGMDNFGQISTARYRNWLQEQSGEYRAERDYGSSHAHSLYLNTLAERGAFGLAFMLAFLFAWLAALLKTQPRPDDNLAWALWGASLSAWLATVSIGLVNTTLHSEHALLAVMFLGAWLAHCRRKTS
jgi:O-antigen ligase